MKTLDSLRDRLSPSRTPNEAGVVAGLSSRTQVELKEIEDRERSDGARPKVLDKLRYLRGREPLDGYDALEPEEIGRALDGVSVETLDAVREYERKFRGRPVVLDEVARVRHSKSEGS